MLDDSYQIWTGNRMLDMILNQKTKDAKEKETDMQIETEVFETLPFSDREIISLFGNVLDNALEACERIQDKKRWIKIKIKKKNHLLYIETSNAIKEMPVQNQKEFVSVKEDEILHGYGMKNIQDIVRKYDGIFRYKIYGEYLVCIISIYDIRGRKRNENGREKETDEYYSGDHTSDIFSVSVDEYNGRTEEFYYVCNCCVEKSQLCRYI